MRVSPVKGGHGHITAYKIVIGSAVAKRCGFILESGDRPELQAIENLNDKSITIKVKEKPAE